MTLSAQPLTLTSLIGHLLSFTTTTDGITSIDEYRIDYDQQVEDLRLAADLYWIHRPILADGTEVLVQTDDYPVTATVTFEPASFPNAAYSDGYRLTFFSSRRGEWFVTPEGLQRMLEDGTVRA
jgi:hypothetical protein